MFASQNRGAGSRCPYKLDRPDTQPSRIEIPNPYDFARGAEPLLRRVQGVWNPELYRSSLRALMIGEVLDKVTFSTKQTSPSLIRLVPIKFPGSVVRLPPLALQALEATQKIVNHCASVNPLYSASYAYLTFFSGEVPAGRNGRVSFTVHGDQMQSLDPRHRYNSDYTYLVSDGIPTTFYDHPFDLTRAVEAFNRGEPVDLYAELSKQADESRTYHSKNYGIYLIDPYVVHRASEAESAQYRVFAKVVFSTQRLYDRRETYRNPGFEYNAWYSEPATGPDFLPFADPNTAYLKGGFSSVHPNVK